MVEDIHLIQPDKIFDTRVEGESPKVNELSVHRFVPPPPDYQRNEYLKSPPTRRSRQREFFPSELVSYGNGNTRPTHPNLYMTTYNAKAQKGVNPHTMMKLHLRDYILAEYGSAPHLKKSAEEYPPGPNPKNSAIISKKYAK